MTTTAGVITSIRVTHTQANLDAIEAHAPEDLSTALDELLSSPGVSEAFVMTTCHRVEAYVVTSDQDAGKEALHTVFDPGPVAEVSTHQESLHHLLRVATGLDSAVIGEDQVLGQLKNAAATARDHDALGPILDAATQKAAHVGERARTETAINDGVVSLGSAAATFAANNTTLTDATALVVGAGEMGRLAAKALATTDGISTLVIANRTPTTAATIADTLPIDATGTDLESIPDLLKTATVVVTATASDTPIITEEDLVSIGETMLIDFGNPRDVDATDPPDQVTLHDLDDVETVTEAAVTQREHAATAVESMVETELQQLLDHLKRQRADDVIATMYESADIVKRRELNTAVSRMEAAGDLTDEQREAVEDLADSVVAQLLAAPTRSLRDAAAEDDWETIHTALTLFNPSFDEGSPFDTSTSGEDRSSNINSEAQDSD